MLSRWWGFDWGTLLRWNSMLHIKLIDWEVLLIIFSLLYFKLLQVVLTVCGKLWCNVRWHSEVGKGGWTGHGSRSAVYPAKIKHEKNLPAEENEKGKTSLMESKSFSDNAQHIKMQYVYYFIDSMFSHLHQVMNFHSLKYCKIFFFKYPVGWKQMELCERKNDHCITAVWKHIAELNRMKGEKLYYVSLILKLLLQKLFVYAVMRHNPFSFM